MPRFSITFAGIVGSVALCWSLFAQEVRNESRVPRAEPVDPAVLREKDVPRALPIEPESDQDVPRAKPVTAAELEEIQRLRREREEKQRLADDEAMRLKREREEKRRIEEARENQFNRMSPEAKRLARPIVEPAEPVIPRALPAGTPAVEPAPKPERVEGLDPLKVARERAPDRPERPEEAASKIKASWETRTDARSLTMLVPAPRGQIVDRWGYPLAQNKVANVLAIKLPHREGTPNSEVIAFARARVNLANSMLGKKWTLSDEEIATHFKNRRWLPLMFSSPLTPRQEETIAPRLGSGMILFPTYIRHYPEHKIAAHIVGYAGKTRPLSIKPIASGDQLFPALDGREGLELSFDANLQGTPGIVNYLFDSDGTQLDREIAKNPIPGATIVTTLDLEMQKIAEEILASSVKRGAFVVMNVHTGEILTMASYPAYDPNEFSPSISHTRFGELVNDLEKPLFPRAFQGSYPPASTFKVAVALAALDSGAITEQTLFPCPTVMMIDNRPFRNWNKKAEDDMNVVVAIGRSCNPFFYKAGMRTGADNISSMGHRLGFGQKTGIQIFGEASGFMPTDAAVREQFGHSFAGGYLANASIGQGDVSATPLQVCQMMAAIANGRALPQARLVKQVQDHNNRVIKHFPPQDRNLLNVEMSSLDPVRRGMVKVVNASWGTGKAASNDYVTLAGKTGTGQWGPLEDKKNVAWFAGFVPFENPEYAFAVLYEGDKGETIGGGRIAAPLAGKFFNAIYEKKKAAGELEGYARASSGPDSRSPGTGEPDLAAAPSAEPVPETDESKAKKRRGFFHRLGRPR